jgi:hypothetical protein
VGEETIHARGHAIGFIAPRAGFYQIPSLGLDKAHPVHVSQVSLWSAGPEIADQFIPRLRLPKNLNTTLVRCRNRSEADLLTLETWRRMTETAQQNTQSHHPACLNVSQSKPDDVACSRILCESTLVSQMT